MSTWFGKTFARFADYLTPTPAPATPFKNGFDAFMKKKDPAYTSYTKLFDTIGPLSEDNDAFAIKTLVLNFLDDLEDIRDVTFPETATTIHDQIKSKGEVGAKFEDALVDFFTELHEEVFKILFADLHESLKDATVYTLQTDDTLHVEAYLVAILWLLISHLYMESALGNNIPHKVVQDYKKFEKNTQVFEAALLLAKQAPRFNTYAEAFYAFKTGTVGTLPLSNLTEAKQILLDFLFPFAADSGDMDTEITLLKKLDETLKSSTLDEADRVTLEKEKEVLTKRLKEAKIEKAAPTDKNEVYRSTLIIDEASQSYMVLKMTTETVIPADYVPVGQPCLDAEGNILQAFTNRPEDMFPLLVEGTVLMTE